MTVISYEQAGELKIGQVGIANLRVRDLDIAALAEEMRQRVVRAPKMFARAPVILDFGGLARLPSSAEAFELIAALREAGVLPIGLAYGSRENDALAIELGLPLLAKFRAQYERDILADAPPPAPPPAPATKSTMPTPAPAASADGEPGLMQVASVRSGQQVYAEQRDLTVVGAVGAAAEVMADGSIHVYGPLRGRALAGARGMETARIFCREFHAELVAIAGQYRVAEDFPREALGRAVQVYLDGGELQIKSLE
ncbi:septum site-determining protein MinC [Solilutibacter pythonis]|uniref:septum site-determining protein MinC n=1 Tax=Solilutibacter pythonis TaxID=2483112 RepID=UPI001FE7E323|nr:septum site-determining protein MinC [Lysobacter pythonis]